jgi:uncharacterized membrane protein
MLNRKGSKNHILIGRVYVGAMWWICLSAWAILFFYRFSAFLMVIAVLTFHASFVGVRVLRRKKLGSEEWYDWAVSIITVLFGLGIMIYAVNLYFNSPSTILAFLSGLFGFFTLLNGLQDIRFFIQKPAVEKNWWLRQHIGAMGGSYIAAITAFAVQNPNIFMPESSYQWLLWILPGVIGTPLISVAGKRWERKFKTVGGVRIS